MIWKDTLDLIEIKSYEIECGNAGRNEVEKLTYFSIF